MKVISAVFKCNGYECNLHNFDSTANVSIYIYSTVHHSGRGQARECTEASVSGKYHLIRLSQVKFIQDRCTFIVHVFKPDPLV